MEQSTLSRRVSGAALPITAFLLPPLALFAPLGTAPLFLIATLVLLFSDWRRCLGALTAAPLLLLFLITLGMWAAASSLWSVVPQHSLLEGLRFLAECAGGLILIGAARTAGALERRNLAVALLLGIVIALVVLATERFLNEPLTRLALGLPPDAYLNLSRYDRGVTVLVLVLWPALFALESWALRGLLFAATLAMAAAMASAAALLAAVTGVAVFALGYFIPRTIAGAMILATLTLAVVIPLATPRYEAIVAVQEHAPWIKLSGIHRLFIWRFSADRVAERPILGWGMDASRAVPGGNIDIKILAPTLYYPTAAEALPLHPHDAILQVQLELGLPGLALGLAIITTILWPIGWHGVSGRARRAGALALAAAALTVGLLSFGVWQAWWVSSLWLISAFYTVASKSERGDAASC